jgi:hypothetical protein
MRSAAKTLAIAIAALLLFNYVQCVTACSGLRCETSSGHAVAPPCHEDQKVPTERAPSGCSHVLTVADSSHGTGQIALADFGDDTVPAQRSPLLPFRAVDEGISCDTSPPGPCALSSVILRI